MQRCRQFSTQQAAVLRHKVVGLPLAFIFQRQIKMDGVGIVAMPVPDLVHDAAPARFAEKRGRLHRGPRLGETVIVAQARNKKATGLQPRPYRAQGTRHLVRHQVWKRIVQRRNDVKRSLGDAGERRHVGDMEVDRQSPCFRLTPCSHDRRPAQIGTSDPVAARGESKGLCAYAARTVEDLQLPWWEPRCEQGLKDAGLTLDSSVLIVKDKVIVAGEIVVKRERAIVHASTS